jgi:hypothetical protein
MGRVVGKVLPLGRDTKIKLLLIPDFETSLLLSYIPLIHRNCLASQETCFPKLTPNQHDSLHPTNHRTPILLPRNSHPHVRSQDPSRFKEHLSAFLLCLPPHYIPTLIPYHGLPYVQMSCFKEGEGDTSACNLHEGNNIRGSCRMYLSRFSFVRLYV